MTFKKDQVISYLVDCNGYSLEEASDIWKDIRGDVEEIFSREQIAECAEFNGVKVTFGEGNMTNYAVN